MAPSGRAAGPPARFGGAGRRQHRLRLDGQEGIERGVPLDAGQHVARHLDRRQVAAPVAERQLGATQIGHGAHLRTSDPQG
jgi:hypothetical protein